jgi:hypothetical protein
MGGRRQGFAEMSFSVLETNSRNRPVQIIAEVTTGNAHLTGIP